MGATTDRWFEGSRLNPAAELQLVCLPYAGGSSAVFRPWWTTMPPWVDLLCVQLPGRGSRRRDRPYSSMDELADDLAAVLGRTIVRPFALFGHSMGALVAYEVAHRLIERAREPLHVFVAGSADPRLRAERGGSLHRLSDEKFRGVLRAIEATPPTVLEHEELMKLLIPTLRADFAACETYVHRARGPLGCALSAYGGLSDRQVGPHHLDGWRAFTTGEFTVRRFPGGHFFLTQMPGEVGACVAAELEEHRRLAL